MPRIQTHTHKLKRHKYKSTGSAVFFCVLDCAFKSEVPLTLGKKNICWRCGAEFLMNEQSIRLARPHCMDCTKRKDEMPKVDLADIASNIQDPTINSMRDRLKTITTVEVEDEL